MIFICHGERNSGTTFLYRLLKYNFGNDIIYECGPRKNCTMYDWKHGNPFDNDYTNNIAKNNKGNLSENDEVHFFIYRDLNGWLSSIYVNKYEINLSGDMNSFLTNKNIIEDKHHRGDSLILKKTNKLFYEDDNNKTIFDIRYFKYKKNMEFFEKNNNVIIANLSYICDDENCKLFLSEIDKLYNVNNINKDKCFNYKTKFPHTKDGSNRQNRNKYSLNQSNINIINKNKDNEIEEFINNLGFIIKNNNGDVTKYKC